MPSITQRIRYWLEDHNPFEAPSTRSARRRLRESNAAYGESNTKIRRDIGPDGLGQGLVSTINPYAETVEELFESTRNDIRAAAAELPYLIQAFLGQNIPSWTLEDLDRTFSAWQLSADKGRFTEEKVVEITGAAFGEYCNLHLKTRWLIISDPAGRQAAIRSPNNRVTGWPFSTVRKRINAGEHDFFAAVYESLRRSVQETYAD
jgi:Domain of unknown function (DUF3806)